MAPLELNPALLARRLRKVRELRKLNQTQAAQVTGVPQSMISRYENFSPGGHTTPQTGQLPNISNLTRLANGYRCSIDWLVGRSEEMGVK